jgi:hypothetical protein
MMVIGIALAVAFDAVAAILNRRSAARAIDGARLFILIWGGIVAVDFGFGVAAGYSVSFELLVHIAIFALPAAAVWYLARRRRAPPEMPP